MPFGAHETMEVHEILNEKQNVINHLSLYSQQIQQGPVKQLIEKQLQNAIQQYDQLVMYTHEYNAAPISGQQPVYGLTSTIQSQPIQYGLNNPVQQVPQMSGNFSEPQILQALLIFHKNAAKTQMIAAVEIADPNLRQLLIQFAVSCANEAYEVFSFMNQQGLYQVPTLVDRTAKTFLHSYQPIQQQQTWGVQQQPWTAKQAPIQNTQTQTGTTPAYTQQQQPQNVQ